MDLNNLDSRKGADRGAAMHVTHPSTGEPMHNEDGSPCLVYVLGAESPRAQEIQREANKLEKLGDGATFGDWHDRLCFTAERLIIGFENIFNGKKPANRGDIEWFLNLNMANPTDRGAGPSYVEQVLRFSGSRANYLGKSGAASSEPPSKSAGKTQRPTNGQKREAKS